MMKVSWEMGFFSFCGTHQDKMVVHRMVAEAEVLEFVEAVTKLGFEPSVEMSN